MTDQEDRIARPFHARMALIEAKRIACAAAQRFRSATQREVVNDPWTYAINTMVENEVAAKTAPLRKALAQIWDHARLPKTERSWGYVNVTARDAVTEMGDKP